jgi:hypothetical protein
MAAPAVAASPEEARLRREQAEQARRILLQFSRDAEARKLEDCASELDRIAVQLESWANSKLPHQ